MRINKFFAAALAATTLFASCAKEDGGDTTVKAGEETYAGFSISIPMAPAGTDTRAGGAEDNTAATTAESKIENIAVFIVDGTTVDKLYLTTENTHFTFNSSTGLATASEVIRTTTGAKKIYIVANYTNDLKTAIESLGSGAFSQGVIALDETKFVTTGNALTMTGMKEETLTKKDQAAALLAPINVDVYRNLAKVAVRQSTANSHQIVGGGWHQSTSLKFALAAKAKGAWLYNTPNDGATATAYSVIPDAAKDASTGSTHAYWNNFSSLTIGTNGGDWKDVNASTVAANAMLSWYAHENIYATMLSGNTTIARLKGAYIPAKTVTGYNASTGARTEATNSASTTPATFRRLDDGSFWSQAAYTAATTNTADPFAIAASRFSEEYINGIGYYKIMVMDQGRVPVVKRNNFYELSIEAIEGPGAPTEVGAGEDIVDPLDEESYVAVTVQVKPWWKQSTGHTIQ